MSYLFSDDNWFAADPQIYGLDDLPTNPIYNGSDSTGSSVGTSNRSATYTPAPGDLLVVFCAVVNNANTTPTCTDDQGGTYDRITVAQWTSSGDTLSAFVRTAAVTTENVHTVTVNTGSNDGGVVGVVAVSHMFRF